jgi:GDP-L-fucose synthase
MVGMELRDKKILLTGGGGFLGSAVKRELLRRGASEENIFVPRSTEYDLREKEVCKKVVQVQDIVIHAAASVGGLKFVRDFSAQAFYDSAAMALHMIEESYRAGVEKFVGIGSVCSYPKLGEMPFKEESLWDGYPEPDNAHYGLAKKMMLVQTQAYQKQYGFNGIHLLLVNLYGPHDNFDPERSHVIPALIRKVAEAKKENKDYVEVWGTGSASREFLYVDDAANGIVLATEKYDKPEPVNIGSGEEVTIKNLVETICELMDYNGEIRWDASKPDGQPRRKFDVSRAEKEFGYTSKTDFKTGLQQTIDWYLSEKQV